MCRKDYCRQQSFRHNYKLTIKDYIKVDNFKEENTIDIQIIDGKEVRVLSEPVEQREDPARKHVFIIGSKGIPAAYGGFETFVEKLTEYRRDERILYHVARMDTENRKLRYEYNGAYCFNVKVPNIGPAKAVYYDLAALDQCISYCEKHSYIREPIFYVLACRIGPFINRYKKRIQKLGGKLFVNPDGHEWKRSKWSAPVRKYWKISEQGMVKHADLLVCDSVNIEKYIKKEYRRYKPRTIFLAYGSDLTASTLDDHSDKFCSWLREKRLEPGKYYLIVGRFVPENNFETMIREFMCSDTERNLAIITTKNERFFDQLEKKLHFSRDTRIRFVGTVYDDMLLKKIREEAFAYLHGHEVGGTNPSLLEALGSTKINLLLNVGFNKEVGRDSCLYWTKEAGNLATLIHQIERMTGQQIDEMGEKAKERIRSSYSWRNIVDRYENLFITEEN